MNQYKCELLLLLLLSLSSLSVVIFFFIPYSHIFFLCFRGSLQEWTLLCSPVKATASKPKTTSGLIPFSANTLTLPASSCKRLMHRMAGGGSKYREGEGRLWRFRGANTTAASITNSCWQLDSLEMQSNHCSKLILLLETQQTGRSCAPNSCGQVRKVPLPGEEKPPQALAYYSDLHGDHSSGSQLRKVLLPPAIWQWLISVAVTAKRGLPLTQGLVQGASNIYTGEPPKQKNYPTPNVNSAKVKNQQWGTKAHTLKTFKLKVRNGCPQWNRPSWGSATSITEESR